MGIFKLKILKLFIDFDGTILDSRKRLYKLFNALVPVSSLSFCEYWAYKRNKLDHHYILKSVFDFSSNEINVFKTRWLELIESPEYLSYDIPFQGVAEYLSSCTTFAEVFLLTARQSEERVHDQLARFGLSKYFTDVLVTGGNKDKYDLVTSRYSCSNQDWIIGDTGYDVNIGKRLNIRTAAVCSGFLSKEKLQEYKPDLLVETIIDLKFDK